MDGRVSVRDALGFTRVLRDDVSSANGITFHHGRLFVGECCEGGRLMEFDLSGGPPRILLASVPSPNAMEFGPDGLLYFPVMGANEIWCVDPDGGRAPETVVDGLQCPQGILSGDGQLFIVDASEKAVIVVDLASGVRATVAAGLAVGPPPGVEPKPLGGMPPFSGPQGPFAGIAMGADGTLYVSADGEGSVLALRRDRA